MSNIKILIVEDDIIVAKDIKRILHNLGYSVTSIVTTGKEALVKAEEDDPDLVLMDIVLNDKLSGIETARRIRQLFDIPIVYISAHCDKKIVDKAKKTDPFGYLIKPVDEKSLHITIEIALFKHAIEKKLKEKMQQILRESEDRYKHIVKNINQGIVMQDEKGIIIYVNEKFLEMMGYTQAEIIGHSITDLLGEGLLKKNKEKKTREEKERYKSFEFAWQRKDGQRVFTILSPKPIYDEKGHFKGSVVVLTDITERRRVERELHQSREELRSLSQHLQSVREKESKRIAREIHDELGQMLTALKMDLSWLCRKIPSSDDERKKFLKKEKSMSDLIDKTIKTVQKISSELRPGLLDDLGLVPAIEWLAQDFQTRTKIQCRTQIDCDGIELGPDFSTAIFRISQEALTNVARHSNATRVNISFKGKNGTLLLKISDNGKGITEKDIFAPSSLGLMGMRERIRPFRGELNITGTPEKGTVLTAIIPLERF